MTDPLIDRDALIDVIADAPVDTLIADTVLGYLHSVLTPEALIPTKTVPHGEYVLKYLASGGDMRRRILGDDT